MKKQKGILLLSIGDEILDGRIQNTNASWMGEQFRLHGIPVSEIRAVSDRIEDIQKALKDGQRFSLVISTGGLGPTNDDRTLIGAAKCFRRPLLRTKLSLAHITKRYEERGLPLTEARLRMADIPKGSKVLENLTGTAPGISLPINQTHYFFLPGPPNECRPMFEKFILPLAQKKLREKTLLKREFWRTFGKGESDVFARVADFIQPLEKKYPKTFAFGVHISFPCIDLTLEVWKCKGEPTPTKKELDDCILNITNAMGPLCFTHKRESLVETVFRLLQERKLTLSLAESCTGGMVAKLFTDFPGSSSVIIGGVVSYAYSAKEILLGVKSSSLQTHGAVSEVVVKEMAENIRTRLATDYSIALSGISGPGGETDTKPVGTIHVAISSKSGLKTLHQVILNGRGSRDQNRVIAAHLALDALRAEILGLHT